MGRPVLGTLVLNFQVLFFLTTDYQCTNTDDGNKGRSGNDMNKRYFKVRVNKRFGNIRNNDGDEG